MHAPADGPGTVSNCEAITFGASPWRIQAHPASLPILIEMPPRRRPSDDSSFRAPGAADPVGHLPAFLRYQEVEAGMARNTVIAYRSDLVQFFEWFAKHGPGRLGALDLK